jgi:hypothetical protein
MQLVLLLLLLLSLLYAGVELGRNDEYTAVIGDASVPMASLLDCIPPSTDSNVLASSASSDGVMLLGAAEREMLRRYTLHWTFTLLLSNFDID